MKKILLMLSLLVIALFVVSCAPKEAGEEGALAGQAVSAKKIGCTRECYSACYDQITGKGKTCTSEKISLSLNKQEKLSAVKPELTKVDLPILLADGTVAGNQYTQKLVFNDQTSSYIDYLENDNDVQDNFFYLKSGQQFAQYTLTFTAPLLLYSESSITGAAVSGGGGSSGPGVSTTNILENSKIKLLGEEFTVIKASPYTTEKGLEIVMKSSTGKLFLLKDNDMTNDIPDSTEMEIDYEKINGATVTIKGEPALYSSNPKIDSITIKMVAEDDFYVSVGEKLSASITAAAEEKEILFTNNWDLKFVSYDSGAGKGTIEIGKFC
ncbi:hypothetical protein HZC30_03780 [Candidatus Woesearchaeota archaeon]|nr:hypothetical protein [Candidatus Woesearchaeota archaeon]